jgi:hypothetical protein
LTADLQAARRLSGDRCLVVATINRPGGSGLNRAITAFSNSDLNAVVADWKAAVREDPGLLASDHIHATPAGYAERARVLAEAVETCMAGSVPGADQPAPRREPRAVAPDETRPSRIDWAALPGARGFVSYYRTTTALVDGALRTIRAALAGPPPEPVLGEP